MKKNKIINSYHLWLQLTNAINWLYFWQSKESVLFIFNKPFLVDSGPYEAEFRGEQHCVTVPAILLNSCVLQVHTPGTVKCSS